MANSIDHSERPFEFTFKNCPDDDTRNIRLSIEIGVQCKIDPLTFNREMLVSQQERLSDALKSFVNASDEEDRMLSLRRLATTGWELIALIETRIREKFPSYRENWRNDFLNHFQGRNIARAECYGVRELVVRFPAGFTYPIGLLFDKSPSSIDWKNTTINEVIGHFFDIKFAIHHVFDNINGNIVVRTLKTGTPIKVIHAIDDNLNTDQEQTVWGYDNTIDAKKVYNNNELINEWLSETPAKIIHFSSHFHSFDGRTARSPYAISLSNGDQFFGYQLTERLSDLPNTQALVFINACRSGNIHNRESVDIITDLYPKYSLGFIATTYDIFDKTAGHLPNKFYQLFIGKGKSFLQAFNDAKRFLILAKGEYTAWGYVMWQANPKLLYEIKNKEKNDKTKSTKKSKTASRKRRNVHGNRKKS